MNTPRKSWHSIQFIVKPEAVEAVEFALNSLEALGTEVDLMQKPAAGVCVSGFFEQLPIDSVLEDELQYALKIHDLENAVILSVETIEVRNADWLAEWKKHWKPTTVGRFIITPPWEKVDEPEKIVISIEPNMAFGTGTHATTQLCLEAIGNYLKAGESFLDVGTGTGILAIAAAKFGKQNTEIFEELQGDSTPDNSQIGNSAAGSSANSALRIFAIDTDPDSIKIARENAALNGVASCIQYNIGTIETDIPKFDFICANLTLDVILPVLSLLIAKANNTLVLSGILADQEAEIVTALRDQGVEHPAITTSAEWIAVQIRKI